MRRIVLWSAAAVLPAVLVSALVGCSGGGTTGGGSPATNASTSGGSGGGKPTAIAVKETGTLKGKVTFKGDKAALKLEEMTKTLQAEMGKKDADHCLKEAPKEQTEQQVWRIAEDGGLANVVVYLKAPQGKFFSVDPEKAKFDKEKVLDQPHCAFVPHVSVLFPEARKEDGTRKPTGQTFTIKNSAMMNHNTSIEGTTFNQIIDAGNKVTVDEANLKPSSKPITFKCSIHQYMTGYAFSLDHPYAAVTNEKGEFEIPNVPADVDVLVTVWHEAGASKDYEKGKDMKLKAGENKMEFTVEPK
jgi:hypothetical protein